MEKFKQGETVVYNGHRMEVIAVRNNGETADLKGEIVPFIPTICKNVSYKSVQR